MDFVQNLILKHVLGACCVSQQMWIAVRPLFLSVGGKMFHFRTGNGIKGLHDTR